jgi:phospholipid/cholesterol/gamma-HCH transport system substrate-binding protein
MKSTLETKLGMFFAVIVISAIFLVEIIGGFEFLKPGIRLRARFKTIQELKVGDPVKLAGVQIGRVEDIALSDDGVEVTMKIKPNTKVRTNSRATIKFQGFLGQNFVMLDFGSPDAPIAENNTLLASYEQPDLSSLMTKLDNVATGVEGLSKSLSGETLSNLMGPFTDFFKDNKEKFAVILSNIQEVTTYIAEGKGTAGKFVKDDSLYNFALATVTNLNDAATGVSSIVSDAREAMNEINKGQGTIGKLVKDEALYKEVYDAATNLKEILQKVNRGEGTVGKLVNNETLFNNAKLTLQKIDKATESLEDQGPLSVISLVAGSLF